MRSPPPPPGRQERRKPRWHGERPTTAQDILHHHCGVLRSVPGTAEQKPYDQYPHTAQSNWIDGTTVLSATNLSANTTTGWAAAYSTRALGPTHCTFCTPELRLPLTAQAHVNLLASLNLVEMPPPPPRRKREVLVTQPC